MPLIYNLKVILTLSILNTSPLWATTPDTCSITHSFLVPQTLHMDTTMCEGYAQIQVTSLQQKVTELQEQLDKALGRQNPLHPESDQRGPDSRGITPNPSFICDCGNTTSFSFGYRDCNDIPRMSKSQSGVYDITPITGTGQLIVINGSGQKYWAVTTSDPLTVYCDLQDNFGWTLLMRRSKMDVNFNRIWEDYKYGFGNMTDDGDFWLGLQTMHLLTTHPYSNYSLWVKIIDKNKVPFIFPYKSFRVMDEVFNYKLKVEGFQGKYGDYLSQSNGKPFISKGCDKHFPLSYSRSSYSSRQPNPANCPLSNDTKTGGGGWWFSTYPHYGRGDCGNANLNAAKPYWMGFGTSDIQYVEMKMRPVE